MTKPVDKDAFPFRDSIGRAVREERARQRLSGNALAKRAKVSRRHLAELQKGANVTVLVLKRVMEALGVRELSLGGDARLTLPATPSHCVVAILGSSGLAAKAAGAIDDFLHSLGSEVTADAIRRLLVAASSDEEPASPSPRKQRKTRTA